MVSWTLSKLKAMSSSSEKLPPETPRPSARAAERLASIVDAAERAALAVIDEAEKEAQRYLEEARGRADLVVAERLREEADRLERRAAGAAPVDPEEPVLRRVSSQDVAPPQPPAPPPQRPATPQPPVPPQPPVVPVSTDEVAQAAGAVRYGGGSAAARLLATQMAVSGSSREEIEMRLRSGFQIEDSGEILDAILGPEAGGDA